MGHVPNLPTKEFAGKSRIGNFGDKIMGRRFTTSAKSPSISSKEIVIAYGEAEVPSPLNGLAQTIGRGGPRRQWSC